MNRALGKLARTIDWRFLESRLGAVYDDDPGRPPLPNRLMAGLAILKRHTSCWTRRWVESPYFQFFCDGMDGPGAFVALHQSTVRGISHVRHRNHWTGYRKERVSGSRRRRQWRSRAQEADQTRPRPGAFFASLASCLVALEACFTAHFWAREIVKHRHEVRMIPSQYVKPVIKRNKTDSAHAEAICEAAGRRCASSQSRVFNSKAPWFCIGRVIFLYGSAPS
ncbi:hypothetical protein QO011_007578 [Labrys wisconsinensis]|uniref:Transposase InsH N-terminal domain-containing protein n=1 Tax=Labrys wisconsinensis TaxID=425677 RepID=A0ABU0JJS9_9HYPH|nr:hypothetical protein [Labrys wisconsinensis]